MRKILQTIYDNGRFVLPQQTSSFTLMLSRGGSLKLLGEYLGQLQGVGSVESLFG